MRKYEDTYRHKGLRKKLIDLLREKGITDEEVLAALSNIPRHFFLDSAFVAISFNKFSIVKSFVLRVFIFFSIKKNFGFKKIKKFINLIIAFFYLNY
jgi:hypothetical protein